MIHTSGSSHGHCRSLPFPTSSGAFAAVSASLGVDGASGAFVGAVDGASGAFVGAASLGKDIGSAFLGVDGASGAFVGAASLGKDIGSASLAVDGASGAFVAAASLGKDIGAASLAVGGSASDVFAADSAGVAAGSTTCTSDAFVAASAALSSRGAAVAAAVAATAASSVVDGIDGFPSDASRSVLAARLAVRCSSFAASSVFGGCTSGAVAAASPVVGGCSAVGAASLTSLGADGDASDVFAAASAVFVCVAGGSTTCTSAVGFSNCEGASVAASAAFSDAWAAAGVGGDAIAAASFGFCASVSFFSGASVFSGAFGTLIFLTTVTTLRFLLSEAPPRNEKSTFRTQTNASKAHRYIEIYFFWCVCAGICAWNRHRHGFFRCHRGSSALSLS